MQPLFIYSALLITIPGEKGFDLKYEAQEGDLFRNVTGTTKGFSFTAKAVRVVDDGKAVTFFVVD